MPIQNYPRFITKSSKTAQQIQSGLPIVGSDGVSGDFNALKVNTDGSINVAGGGGGDATAANQVTQINLAVDGNNFLNDIDNQTITANVHLNGIQSNTEPSANLGLTISNLLEAADILGIWRSAAELLIPSFKNNTLNTCYTKLFNASGGTHIWNLINNGYLPFKIVFNEANVEISDLRDNTGAIVLTNYFDYITTNPIANSGQELIAKLDSVNDYFTQITTIGNAHFTAYYSYQPYIG